MTSEREEALNLALKSLGFKDAKEYNSMLAKCASTTKESPEFKEWEATCGDFRGLKKILSDKQNLKICTVTGCNFYFNLLCTNPTWDSEEVIPCLSTHN